MKFLVAKADLKAALEIVSPAKASTGSDLSCHYLFRRPLDGSMDKVEVLTHSGRMAARSQFVAAIEQNSDDDQFAFTIEGWRLDMWLTSKDDKPLSFSYDEETKLVTATAEGFEKHKPSEWMSLDPKNWHYWDEMLAEAKVTATFPAARLAAALKHSHLFASDEETTAPEYCICEVRDGVLASSDKKGASLIYSPLWAESTLRVHVRDISGIISFLEKHGADDVEIMEHPRTLFFRFNDQYFVESRPLHEFPKFHHPNNDDQLWWVINAGDMKRGIKHLLSAAESKLDSRLILNMPEPGGPIVMSMRSSVSKKVSIVELDVLESGVTEPGEGKDPYPIMPPEGFMITRDRLEDMLGVYDADNLRIGINVKKKGGYIRFSNNKFEDESEANGDNYVTIMTWINS